MSASTTDMTQTFQQFMPILTFVITIFVVIAIIKELRGVFS
jgi:ethanolamine transporter EutH